jgi:hypothetical protein
MLKDILYQIDPNTMVLATFFLVVFAMLMWILGRTGLKENNAIKTTIALSTSLLSTYGLTRTNFDLTFQLYKLGISDSVLFIVTPILSIIFLIFLSRKKDPETKRRKFSFPRFLMIFGVLIIALGLMPFIYQKAFMIITGAVLFIVGLIISIRSKKKDKPLRNRNYNNSSNSNFQTPQTPKGPSEKELRNQGINALINAAKTFKKWAIKQPNPQFVGSWANFINYLKDGNWGNNEKEICKNLHITKNDFIHIFNKYGKV